MSSSMVESTFPLCGVKKEGIKHPLSPKSSAAPRIKVLAAQHLPRGASSEAFSINDLVNSKVGSAVKDVHIVINSQGYLEIQTLHSDPLLNVWHNLLSLSPDIHSCNVQLDVPTCNGTAVGKKNSFVLTLKKDVERGSELLLWFSEELLAMIDMPFLTPKNITGHKKYSCHLCNECFEYPNPLKIHLLLSCERKSMAQLWQKVARTIWRQANAIGFKQEIKVTEQPFQNLVRPSSAHVLPVPTKVEHNTRCISEPPLSAFLPYKKNLLQNQLKLDVLQKSKNDHKSPLINTMQPLNLTMVQPAINNTRLEAVHQPWIDNILELRLSKSLEELSSNYAADVELFASNWGKMKQGHLCVYCGKVYSRKYGLKIHIRTHTGYKPLKCKFCQRPFGDPSNLNKHVRLHASGLTPYMCSLCGKVLVRRRDLERHLKSQHGSEDACSSDDNIDVNNE